MQPPPRLSSRHLLALACLAIATSVHPVAAQEASAQSIVVRGEEVPSAYGAPPSFSRTRFSNLVNAYVLPPGGVFAGLIYQGYPLRFNRPDNMLPQELEVALPYRFGLAIENSVEIFRGNTQ